MLLCIWAPKEYRVISATGLIKLEHFVQFNWAFIMSFGGRRIETVFGYNSIFCIHFIFPFTEH